MPTKSTMTKHASSVRPASMKTRAKHTHVGHCQSCGATHAVELRNECIAKHGYTVDWGYFAGTCSGSGKYPLEVARGYCNNVIESCTHAAVSHEESCRLLRTGQRIPERCDNGVKILGAGKCETIWVGWADANQTLRAKQIERESYAHERQAQHLHAHAKFLTELARRIHGTPLQRAAPKTTQPVMPGMLFKSSSGEQYEVMRVGVQGGYSNRALYTEVRRLSDSRISRMNTAYVREQLKGGANV